MSSNPLGVLLEALESDDRLVQARAAGLLGDLQAPAAVEPLLRYVAECRYHTKTAGFDALARIGDRGAAAAIRPLMDAPNVEDDWYWIGYKSVRAAAATALLALGDEAGAGYLHQLADSDDNVFFVWFAPAILQLPNALPAAAELKDRLTVETLAQEGTIPTRGTDPGMVARVAESLGLIATDTAQAKLRQWLTWRSRYVRGQAAASLLAASACEANLADVEKVVADDPTDFARVKAAEALAKTGQDAFVPVVATAAGSADDPFDRAAAVEALGRLAVSAEVITQALADDDPYVRLCAVEACERIDRNGFASTVAPRKDDENIHVRLQAMKFFAAAEIGGKGGRA